MDSALNLAHRCHRKAEYYLNDNRFREAINCHLKAAEHLSEALMNSTNEQMRASLEVQLDFHSSQESLLKQREVSHIQNRLLLNKRELMSKELMNAKYDRSGGTVGHNSHNYRRESDDSDAADRLNDKDALQRELFEVMKEHDSLLQFLINKETDSESKVDGKATDGQRESPTESLYKSGSKIPKNDKIKIEELQTVNERLRQLVHQLFDDLEKMKRDIVLLRSENSRLRDENRNAYSSTLPELPPLEPPDLVY